MTPTDTARLPDQLRFYSFVAGLYLSPLQCGLQTAHAVSEMYMDNLHLDKEHNLFHEWALHDKTIIILNALNSRGVEDVYRKLMDLAAPIGRFQITLFREDEESLNGAVTAAGIIVPKKYYDVEYLRPDERAKRGSISDVGSYVYDGPDGEVLYREGTAEYELVHILKSYRLV